MTPGKKVAIGVIVVALVLFIFPIPFWVPLVLIALGLGIPLAGWAMLDSSQRRRIRGNRRRSIGG
jgi:MFS superfamily sulfate permease-like transporter